jgi:hypothetical protein
MPDREVRSGLIRVGSGLSAFGGIADMKF